jgi:FKBP-type peptidyl-prolyl cis-trans isomerase
MWGLMNTILASILILFLTLTSSSFAAEKKSIKRVDNYLAVLDIESVGKVEKDVVRPLTDSVRREIMKSGKYEVMDRGNMDKILTEQAFQMTGCTTKECAVEAGQMLGVGKIVVGSVSLVGKTYFLSLSLVNIESGKVELVEDQECKCEVDDLIRLSKQVAGKLMGVEGAVAAVPTAVSRPQERTVKKQEPSVAVAEKNKKDGEDFLAANKKKEGVIALPSGLQYRVLKEGKGKSPKATDSVTVHYRGTLIDGTEFDSSYKRGQPATFPLSRVIRGWIEALQLMKEGTKWELFIPSNLAYGERGAGAIIGSNALLIFEVELLAVD